MTLQDLPDDAYFLWCISKDERLRKIYKRKLKEQAKEIFEELEKYNDCLSIRFYRTPEFKRIKQKYEVKK